MKLLCTILLLVAAVAAAQQQPPVRVNILNVCAPNDADQKEIAAALARIPQRPAFAPDFEVARGRSTSADSPSSRWVRIRHEFAADSPFANVQYSVSVDEKNGVVETVVFRLRQAKDLMQIAVERAQPGSAVEQALASQVAAQRVRLERFGKSSIALARCPEADQSAYEPLFRSASELMARYRTLLRVRRTATADLAKIEGAANRNSPK